MMTLFIVPDRPCSCGGELTLISQEERALKMNEMDPRKSLPSTYICKDCGNEHMVDRDSRNYHSDYVVHCLECKWICHLGEAGKRPLETPCRKCGRDLVIISLALVNVNDDHLLGIIIALFTSFTI